MYWSPNLSNSYAQRTVPFARGALGDGCSNGHPGLLVASVARQLDTGRGRASGLARPECPRHCCDLELAARLMATPSRGATQSRPGKCKSGNWEKESKSKRSLSNSWAEIDVHAAAPKARLQVDYPSESSALVLGRQRAPCPRVRALGGNFLPTQKMSRTEKLSGQH